MTRTLGLALRAACRATVQNSLSGCEYPWPLSRLPHVLSISAFKMSCDMSQRIQSARCATDANSVALNLIVSGFQ